MSVAEARENSPSPDRPAVLDRLSDVGLGYLRLGQPLTTLSGVARQRLNLAIHVAQRATTYVLDEPTTSLHLVDVDMLPALLDRLVDFGATVVVIEHHQAVMAHAHWIVDLGPGAGTTAAGSCSRERRRSSSSGATRSPPSTCGRTSAPEPVRSGRTRRPASTKP